MHQARAECHHLPLEPRCYTIGSRGSRRISGKSGAPAVKKREPLAARHIGDNGLQVPAVANAVSQEIRKLVKISPTFPIFCANGFMVEGRMLEVWG